MINLKKYLLIVSVLLLITGKASFAEGEVDNLTDSLLSTPNESATPITNEQGRQMSTDNPTYSSSDSSLNEPVVQSSAENYVGNDKLRSSLNIDRISQKYGLSGNIFTLFYDNLISSDLFNPDTELFIPKGKLEIASYTERYFDREEPLFMSHIDIYQDNKSYIDRFFGSYGIVGEIKVSYLKSLDYEDIKGFAAYIGANLIVVKSFFHPDLSAYIYNITFLKGNNRTTDSIWYRTIGESTPLQTTLTQLGIKDLDSRDILLNEQNKFVNRIVYEDVLKATTKTPAATSTTSTPPTKTPPVSSTTSTSTTSPSTATTQQEAPPPNPEEEKKKNDLLKEQQREKIRQQKNALKVSLTPNELDKLYKEQLIPYIIEKDYMKFRTHLIVGNWIDINTGEIVEVRKDKVNPNTYNAYLKLEKPLPALKINAIDWINGDLKFSFNVSTARGFFVDRDKMVNDARITVNEGKAAIIINLPNKDVAYFAPYSESVMPEVHDFFYGSLMNKKPVKQDDIVYYSDKVSNSQSIYSFILYPAIPLGILILLFFLL